MRAASHQRIENAYDLRAAMAEPDAFRKHIHALTPKQD